jgi:hemolysin D
MRRDEQAFLPAALALQSTPPSPLGRALLWLLLALVSAVVGWACWARLDIVARAPGTVVPDGRVKVVQPLVHGVVSAIHVREGARVERGALLFELDASTVRARLRQVSAELEALDETTLRLQRLQRWIEGAGAGPADDVRDLAPVQQDLLHREWREYAARIEQLDGEQAQLQAEQDRLARRTMGLRDILELVAQRTSALGTLVEVGHVARLSWLQVEQERQALVAELADLHAQREVLEARMANLVRARAHHHAERLRTIATTQAGNAQRRVQLEQERARSEVQVAQHRLHAPVAGRVQQLVVANTGAVVTPAQVLLRIVPDEPALGIEARLLNRDRGEVRTGMPAVVKVDAFPFTRHGTLAARVAELSADAVADEALGLVYAARVELADVASQAATDIRLEPGMTVSVEVMTGQRRVIELLLAPLLRAFDEAGRER